MICFTDFINSNIGGCTGIAGASRRAYLMPRSNFNYKIYSGDASVNFNILSAADVIPCFVNTNMPYALQVETTLNERGLQKSDKTIEIFFSDNTTLSQKQILQLQRNSWVLIFSVGNMPVMYGGFDNDGQRVIVGYERGLRFVSSSQEFSSTETHGGIVVTMQEIAANKPMIFVNFMDINPVTGVIVSDSGPITIEVGNPYDIDYELTTSLGGAATVPGITVFSENPVIADVTDDLSGTITISGLQAGTTSVKLLTKDGNFSKQIQVTVTA